MRAHVPRRANLGLLLRWQAALFEWEQLQESGCDEAAHAIHSFAAAVERRLARDSAFEPLETRPLDRGALYGSEHHGREIDTTPTIFPFLLLRRDAAGRPIGYLDRDETRLAYEHLAAGSVVGRSIRLGQPVVCGSRGGLPVSALRLSLSLSAPMIVEACGKAGGLNALVDNAMLALDGAAQAALMVSDAAPLRQSARQSA